MNVFGMKKVKVIKDKGVKPYGAKSSMKDVKTTGVKIRGVGAATKGTMARGPME